MRIRAAIQASGRVDAAEYQGELDGDVATLEVLGRTLKFHISRLLYWEELAAPVQAPQDEEQTIEEAVRVVGAAVEDAMRFSPVVGAKPRSKRKRKAKK